MSRTRVVTDLGVYEADAEWAKVPRGWSFGEVAGVATDSRSRVYVFSRSEHPMMVFDRDGEFLASWGEGVFSKPHNVRVSPDGFVYCSDLRNHTVRKFTPEGRLVMTLGTANAPSDTGAEGGNYKTVKRAVGPFNGPTDVAFGPSGDLYVSDGYANARVHRFSAGGKLLYSWGSPGDRPGDFCLPHGVMITKEVLHVVDRENNRVQLFNLKGEFITQWTDFAGPTGISAAPDGTLLLCEFGYDPGVPTNYSVPLHGRRILPRVTVRSPQGELLAKIEGEDRCATGSFFAPHSLCVDWGGDIYVAEVPITRRAPGPCHTLQKLLRR